MAFRFIQPTAEGTFQYILSREIEEPDVVEFNDTPTNGITGVWNGNVTGSKQGLEFEGIGEILLLPSSQGLGTEFLIGDVGVLGDTASGLMFETWMKIETPDPVIGDIYTLDWFDATIQRNELTTTIGYDGIYSNRALFTDPEGDSSSAWYLEIQFAYDTHEKVSLTSANPIPIDTWKHVITMYSSGDPFSAGLLSIYVDGVLDREETIGDLIAWENPSDPHPSYGVPLPARQGQIRWSGFLDEMRLWSTTANPNLIGELASVTSIGVFPELSDLSSEMWDKVTPSADYIAGWWRFESLSAFQILASVPDAVVDTSIYENHATAYFFEGATDFSDEQHGIFGGSSAFPLLRKGTGDGGGMLVIDNLNTTLTVEEGVFNLVKASENTWSASSVVDPEVVVVDEKQIFTGTSGVKVITNREGGGVIHEIDYSDEFLFDQNDYVCSLRLLHTSGSSSAVVTFTLGHSSNSASVTALMNQQSWIPVVVRNTASADANESSITGRVTVQSIESGSHFNIDGFMINEGTHFPGFVAPDAHRKGGQIYWEISD